MTNKVQRPFFTYFAGACAFVFLLSIFLTLQSTMVLFGQSMTEPMRESGLLFTIFALLFMAIWFLFLIPSLIKLVGSSPGFVIGLGFLSIFYWGTAFLNDWHMQRKMSGLHQFLQAEFKTEFVEKCLAKAESEEITFAHNQATAELKTYSKLQFGYKGLLGEWWKVNDSFWRARYSNPYVELTIFGNKNEGLVCMLSLHPTIYVVSLRSFDDIAAESEARHEAAEGMKDLN